MDRIRDVCGFNEGGREPIAIERILGVPITTEGRACQTLLSRGEQFHEVFFDGFTLIGLYRGITFDGAHVIMPGIFPTEKYADTSASQTEKYEWRNEPAFHYGEIKGFRPIGEGLLSACASGFENVSHLGTYLDKDKS